MKKLYPLFLVAIIILSSCGSDDIAELATVTQSATVSQTLDVSTSSQTTFSDEVIFDVSNNGDVKSFGANIDSFQADSITLELKNYVGDPAITLNTTSLLILDADGELLSTTEITDMPNLKELDDSGALFILEISAGLQSAIVASLMEDGLVKLQIAGEVSDAPAEFDAEAIFYFRVTGSLAN